MVLKLVLVQIRSVRNIET